MSAQPINHGLTYGEVREWAEILGCFTASDLAYEMGVDLETGRKSVNALVMHGICANTGDTIDGRHGYEPIVRYVPLPAGPTSYDGGPDPVAQAIAQHGYMILSPRGEVQRIRTERKNRRGMSTPGQRQKMKNRDRNYDRMQEAKKKRADEQKSKAQKDPKWKRKK